MPVNLHQLIYVQYLYSNFSITSKILMTTNGGGTACAAFLISIIFKCTTISIHSRYFQFCNYRRHWLSPRVCALYVRRLIFLCCANTLWVCPLDCHAVTMSNIRSLCSGFLIYKKFTAKVRLRSAAGKMSVPEGIRL